MDFESQLKVEISRNNTDYITATIDGDKTKFNELWNIMISGKPPVPHRASWVVSTCFDKWPFLVQPYISDIIDFIPIAEHSGIKRLLLRILAESDIPEKKMAEILNICFDYLEADMPVAIKVHSMQIIYNISSIEPGLKPELIAIIEDQMPRHSPAFKSRGTKLLKKLYRETHIR